MGHERFNELKEAYALNALPEEERREFDEYLARNPERRAEVKELNSLAGLLALSTREQEPSPKLRRDLMSVVEGEARVSRAESRRGARTSLFTRIAEYFSFQRLALGAAALALIGLVAFNIVQRGEIQDLQSQVEKPPTAQSNNIVLRGSAATRGADVELVKVKGQRAVLVAYNLPPVGKEKTLQIWVIKNDTPKSGGLVKPGSQLVSTPVTQSLEGADKVAITVEPAGGSKAPTSAPVMAAKL